MAKGRIVVEISRCSCCRAEKTAFEHNSGNTFPYKEYKFKGNEEIIEGDPVICSVCQVKNRAM